MVDYTITVHSLRKMFRRAEWVPDSDAEMDLFRIIERNHDPESVYSQKKARKKK